MISSSLLPFLITLTFSLFFPSLHHIPIINSRRRNLQRLHTHKPLAP